MATDGLSAIYQDLLSSSYDCVDRIVLNAYFRMAHAPGGFRVWWRALTGSDDTLENAHLMRLAGRFSRRYTREVFKNFVLKVDWLSFHPTTNIPGSRADNSGVLLRFPPLNASDPANDWKLASDKGYEIQIDDMGFNVDTGQNFSPLHQTGAVYALQASTSLASKPAGQWNTFEIEATNTTIKVTLNGQLVTNYSIPANTSRLSEGHIGLQCHTGNVQFRNVVIRTL